MTCGTRVHRYDCIHCSCFGMKGTAGYLEAAKVCRYHGPILVREGNEIVFYEDDPSRPLLSMSKRTVVRTE